MHITGLCAEYTFSGPAPEDLGGGCEGGVPGDFASPGSFLVPQGFSAYGQHVSSRVQEMILT